MSILYLKTVKTLGSSYGTVTTSSAISRAKAHNERTHTTMCNFARTLRIDLEKKQTTTNLSNLPSLGQHHLLAVNEARKPQINDQEKNMSFQFTRASEVSNSKLNYHTQKQVYGLTSMTTRPAGTPSNVMSKYTLGLDIAVLANRRNELINSARTNSSKKGKEHGLLIDWIGN